MKDLQQKLLAVFAIEHRDHVEHIRSLLALADRAGGPELDEVFRRAHSLKGAARAVDLHPIEGLAHRLETLFARVRQGECKLDPEVTGVVLQVLDASEDCMAGLAENRPVPAVAAALSAIERLLGIESPPPEPVAVVPAAAPVPSFQPREMVRITARNFDGLFRSAASLVSESLRPDELTGKLKSLSHGLALVQKEGKQARQAAAILMRHAGLRSELSRLSSSLDSMERQARALFRQSAAAGRLHRRHSWTLRQLGKQLQQDVWQARMVPAESLLDGFRKMVRDLARDQGKEIQFQAVSAGVHADRRVLEALKDPIMHLLRNAVSHGIEPPADRASKGKAREGRVTLRVDASGQRLTVAVEDDGRGVDLARVAEVAVRERILSEPAATNSSARDLHQILFRPGFSTAATVTDLSGRGMGLSVVYEAVRRLQGDLNIQPAEGGGTAISLSVPLSIATHKLMLVTSGGQTFAIPILGIESLRRAKVASVETAEGKPVVILGGQPVALASIHGLLGLEQAPDAPATDMLHLLILRSGAQRVAVVVDAVLRETDAVVQDLGPAAGCGGRVSSGLVLDDGGIAFVINPMELMQGYAQSRSHWRLPPAGKPAPVLCDPAPPSILVVDDSMTTRTLEKSILEAHGYQVHVAVDGVDALEWLRREKADMVIADVEMPRLNGFGLIEAMKRDPGLERIPVIIVSSLERREDQERGLSLGADAYIVKRRFDQEELLAAIRQIL